VSRQGQRAQRPVDTATAALALGITPSGVHQLAARQRLTRYGTAPRALWSLTEIMGLVDDRDDMAAMLARVTAGAARPG
jgi:hypothetical protein